MASRWAVVPILLALGACAGTRELVRENVTGVKLLSKDTVFVAVPQAGSYEGKAYRDSGRQTSQILASAFARHTHNAKAGTAVQTFDDALAHVRQAGTKYLVYPTILHWEDRATEWSGIPDKVEIKVEVVDAATGTAVATAVLKGKSGWATFGGDHPQELLPETAEEFVAALY